MLNAKPNSDLIIKRSARKYVFVSFLVIAALVGGIGTWAVTTEISGAVVSSGNVVVESNIKKVQHQEGGIVKTVNVRNGDKILAGDLLIQLDDTITKANLAVITKQLDSLYAQESRLTAEQDGTNEISFSKELVALVDKDRLEVIRDSQMRLFNARRNSLSGQKQQLQEQIVQFEKQIDGYVAQSDAKTSELTFVDSELVDLDALLAKKLISASRVSILNRDRARLLGELGGFGAQVAQTKEAMSEREIKILQLDEDFLASVLQQIQEVRSNIARLEEQRIAAQDQLSRIDVRAPLAGTIHNLSVNSVGQVLAPAEVAMLIVPQEDDLVVEAQVQPINIDQISAQQQATIRLPSFDQRTTPELKANVDTISADLLRDEATGMSYYLVRLVIPKDELAKLNDKKLVPGMPVETFIKTDERTVISYLTKPIVDQIKHAMRER